MVMNPDRPNAAHIGVAFELTSRKVWLEGWMHDRDGTATRLTLLAPEGGSAELLPNLFRFRRPDIDEYYGDKDGAQGRRHGFYRYAELDGPSFTSTGWLLELETANGWAIQTPVAVMNRNLIEARDRILASLRHERPGSDSLMREHTHPAIAAIQRRLGEAAAIESVVQLGDPPASPSVSVIVPLYRDLSFLEYQMTYWVRDPQVFREDLIYVLDSPEQAAELDEQARGLYSLYGVPFRIAIMNTNSGFASVNNRASELARASKLLLLNSDVVPSTSGWLTQMSSFYDSTPNIGALGPKLLFEDDSLQHAGMYFYRSPEASVWENMHYFKGQSRHFPEANIVRPVPAITAACMMIDRELFQSVGGLSNQYVQGGYEDSDFCMRLTQEGREHWYMPSVELYHLEDQSYPQEMRWRVTDYNKWLHSKLWADQIERLTEQYPGLEG
jgi:GT2 family glycosyltransferase